MVRKVVAIPWLSWTYQGGAFCHAQGPLTEWSKDDRLSVSGRQINHPGPACLLESCLPGAKQGPGMRVVRKKVSRRRIPLRVLPIKVATRGAAIHKSFHRGVWQ